MKGIRLKQLEEKTGLKKTKLYQLIGEGKFPKPIKIGNASVWIEQEVDSALTKFLDARDLSALKDTQDVECV